MYARLKKKVNDAPASYLGLGFASSFLEVNVKIELAQ